MLYSRTKDYSTAMEEYSSAIKKIDEASKAGSVSEEVQKQEYAAPVSTSYGAID
jgi:hypothetical protein